MNTPLTKTCIVCGNEFRTKKSHYDKRVTCSRKCLGELYKERLKGKNNPNYKNSQIETQCPICGQLFSYYPSMGDRICCSRSCSGIYRSQVYVGENHPMWKGGKANYYGPNWIAQREQTLARDNYTCQRCQAKQIDLKRKLDVHHIKPFRLCADYLEANATNNLISLCPSCHKEAEQESRDLYGAPDYTSDNIVPDGMLTPEQAAQELGLTVWAIYARIRRGQLDAIDLNVDNSQRERPRFLIPVEAIDTTSPPRYKPTTVQQDRAITQLLKQGVSFRKTAKIVGVRYSAVRKMAKLL